MFEYDKSIMMFKNFDGLAILNRQVTGLSNSPVLDRPTLRSGDRGEYVVLLQEQLHHLMFYNGTIDGEFGNETSLSVKAFQTNNKLSVDGIVGKDTWSALINLYAPLASCGGNIHIVQSGDTLWSIARRYNTTVDEIKALNKLTSSALSIGQQLVLPNGTVEPTPTPTTYTVQRGDTLWSIARTFNTTVNEIRVLNNFKSDVLSVGQQLILPNGTVEPTPTPTTYVVQRGDSLWSISRTFNTTVNEIRVLNNLKSDVLSIGQQLILPNGTIEPTPTPTTYIVQRGDTLWSIAGRFNVTVDRIKAFNNLASNLLSIGQQLKIPLS